MSIKKIYPLAINGDLANAENGPALGGVELPKLSRGTINTFVRTFIEHGTGQSLNLSNERFGWSTSNTALNAKPAWAHFEMPVDASATQTSWSTMVRLVVTKGSTSGTYPVVDQFVVLHAFLGEAEAFGINLIGIAEALSKNHYNTSSDIPIEVTIDHLTGMVRVYRAGTLVRGLVDERLIAAAAAGKIELALRYDTIANLGTGNFTADWGSVVIMQDDDGPITLLGDHQVTALGLTQSPPEDWTLTGGASWGVVSNTSVGTTASAYGEPVTESGNFSAGLSLVNRARQNVVAMNVRLVGARSDVDVPETASITVQSDEGDVVLDYDLGAAIDFKNDKLLTPTDGIPSTLDELLDNNTLISLNWGQA